MGIKALKEICSIVSPETIMKWFRKLVAKKFDGSSNRKKVGRPKTNPDEEWMKQVARNITMADIGFLSGCRYLIHDRDTKFCKSFDEILKSVDIDPIRLPARSPNLNAYAERLVLSVKSECLSKLIFFGQRSLMHVLNEYLIHYHEERNHQGKNNLLLFPSSDHNPKTKIGTIECKEHLSGMLKYYYRKAA